MYCVGTFISIGVIRMYIYINKIPININMSGKMEYFFNQDFSKRLFQDHKYLILQIHIFKTTQQYSVHRYSRYSKCNTTSIKTLLLKE